MRSRSDEHEARAGAGWGAGAGWAGGRDVHPRSKIRRLFPRELPKSFRRALEELPGHSLVAVDEGFGASFRGGIEGLHLL